MASWGKTPTPSRGGDGPFIFGADPSLDCELYERLPVSTNDSDTDALYKDGTTAVLVKERRAKQTKQQKTARHRQRIKCVLLGDDAVGKTSLITSYAQNVFRHEYKPTAFDNYKVIVEVDGKPVNVEICDTAGKDSMEALRKLCYPGSDVIILCFSVVKPDSFRSIANKWATAIASVRAPLILVGTQCDLRDNYRIINDLKLLGENPISEQEARILGENLRAPYIETSSKNRSGLKDAFDAAILAALPAIRNKKKRPWWKKIFCPFFKSDRD